MFKERTLTEQEYLARKIAMAQGPDIDRLILSFKKQEDNNPNFEQYLEGKEVNWEKK